MLLKMLAEAVNAVADWPQYTALADDNPLERSIGYRVGPLRFQYGLTQVRRDLPHVNAKCAQLERMVAPIKLPLKAFPEHQKERELFFRLALLRAAVHLSDAEMRQETARWITMLGRLRADPSGAYLQGVSNHEGLMEPEPRFFL